MASVTSYSEEFFILINSIKQPHAASSAKELDKVFLEAWIRYFPRDKPCQQHTREENSAEGEVTPLDSVAERFPGLLHWGLLLTSHSSD